MNLAYVDSSVWIALLEGIPAYRDRIDNELTKLEQRKWILCTSEVVSLEVLIKPYHLQREDLIQAYKNIFNETVHLLNFTNAFQNSLHIAGQEKLKVLDTIHLSFAMNYGCGLFVTTDPHFKTLKCLPVHFIDLSSSVSV